MRRCTHGAERLHCSVCAEAANHGSRQRGNSSLQIEVKKAAKATYWKGFALKRRSAAIDVYIREYLGGHDDYTTATN